MASLTESNISLHFPDSKYFRFENCEAHSKLSGNHFKEVDICWYETVENKYWLIELKDFSHANTGNENNIKSRVNNILKKAIDSFCVFLSAKHNYKYGKQICKCLPVSPDNSVKFKILTVVHCKEAQRVDIQLMNNLFRNKFKPYAVLFDIQDYGIIEHSRAKKLLLNKFKVT